MFSRKRRNDGDTVAPPTKKLEASAPRPREKSGLFILKDKEDASADIVAVHGLGGDAYNTWTKDEKLWLRDFLPNKIPDARIMSYGYNSAIAFSKSVAGIDDFAVDLLSRLGGERETPQSKARPIVFICHSLGGIVVKKALILAHERSDSYGNLLEMAKGVIFMGTPHRGSDVAYWADFLARALHSAQLGSATNKRLLPDLQTNSKTLSDISTQFIERGARLNIRTFYETEILDYMTSLVVDVDSARLNLPNELPAPIQANHRTMCKFSNEDEQKYKPVWRAVKQLVESAMDVSVIKPVLSLSKEEKKCLRSLKTSNYDDHKRSIAARLEGTCTWFLQHAKYLAWMKEGKLSLILISGDPGCGKSVLSSFLIDELKSATKHSPLSTSVCFFFCDDKVESQKDAKAVLCGLLHQVISANRSLIKHAMPHFEASPQITDSMAILWDIFKAVSSDPEAGNIICIIDALDECEESSRRQLIKLFVDYLTETPHSHRPFLKVLMTSRPYESIERDFRHVPYVRLRAEGETEKIGADVAQVIKKRLRDFQSHTRCSDDARVKIEEQLTRNADRTFLWVSVVLELLENSPEASTEALGRVVTTLPKELDGVYDSILQKIPNHEKTKAKRVLTIVVGARRPLSLQELNIALGIRESDRSIGDMRSRLEPDMERTVKGLCGPFVRVINSRVLLVHQTAKEFLVKSSGTCDLAGGSWKHCIDPVDSNLVISQVCIWYLLFTIFKLDPLDLTPWYHVDREKVRLYVRKHDLLDYAACNWLYNFKEAQKRADSELLESAVQLYDTQSKSSKTWLQVYSSQNFIGFITSDMTNLMLASYFGHETVVGLLIDNGVEIDAKNGSGDTALHLATERGHEAVVGLLIDKGADVDAKNDRRKTALHRAVEGEYWAVVRLLIDKRADVCVKDGSGNTALHGAAMRGHKAVVGLLIDKGVDVDAKNDGGKTALHLAAESGHEAVVGLLIGKGADVDAESGSGETALHIAVGGGHEAVVGLLIGKGADVDAGSGRGVTALHIAAGRGHEAMVGLLIDKGAEVGAKDGDGEMALHWATIGGHKAVVELLINKGAEINAKGGGGRTALYKAARRGHEMMVRLLIDKGADVDANSDGGRTALHEAADRGHETVVRLLIDKGAEIDVETGYGNTELHRAAMRGYEAVVGLLINKGAEVSAKDAGGNTALHWAAMGGHEAVVGLLIDKGADVDAKDGGGRTALHRAAKREHWEAVRLLIDKRADVCVKDGSGNTALHWAAMRGHEAVVGLLIDKRADVYVKDGSGNTALHWAAMRGYEAVVGLLIDKGADVDAKDGDGRTALHRAAESEHWAVVGLLLVKGAEVCAKDGDGNTVLHWAAVRGCEVVVGLLIDKGADVDAKNDGGKTALHWAAKRGHGAVVELLIDRGADIDAEDD